MKSLINIGIVLLAVFVFYLYTIHSEIDTAAMISSLENRLGQIDVQERKLKDLRDRLEGEIGGYNSTSKKTIDSLNLKKESLTKGLAYNKKIRIIKTSKLNAIELAEFDSINIKPFRYQIDQIQKQIDALTPDNLLSLKEEISRELNRYQKQQDTINYLIIKYSSHFFPTHTPDGLMVIENGRDELGRRVVQKDQLKELSDAIFGKSTPTQNQIETFVQFHRYWCELPYDHPSEICLFSWLQDHNPE